MVRRIKPLQVLWSRYPRYSPKNTIMFDDIERNFAFNPQTGLRIKPYRDSAIARHTDRELFELKDYLLLIASLPDFTVLDHKRWREYVKEHSK